MRVLVHDFSGHPFQAQLSRALARRGHNVCHAHCGSYQTGKGALTRQVGDEDSLIFASIGMDDAFDRYTIHRRIRQELLYGRRFTRLAGRYRPDVILSSNDPLFAKAVAAQWCRSSRTPWVFWLQDVYSVAMSRYASHRLGRLGATIGSGFQALERRLLRQAARVVAITPDFDPLLHTWGVLEDRRDVIENWAPIDELPPVPKCNEWSREVGLDGFTVFLYAGTLGVKHDPSLLLELAQRFEDRQDVRVVVVSEGAGAEWLKRHIADGGVANLLVMPYQPYERLPEVFGTADVLLTLLSPDAGVFSVPSKVLSYLCAGRPILAAMPLVNLAARTLQHANAGMVVSNDDREGFFAAADKLLSDESLRQCRGEQARRYAERAFDIDTIASRFEAVLAQAAAGKEAQ
jgi:colanic acid biosynthesis glycosyl transferase WcaI